MRDKNTVFQQKKTLNIGGSIMDLSKPAVMGILNITPDSFYQQAWKDPGKIPAEKQVLEQAEKMLSEGADFIDIGAYSSRPGAEYISEEEEMSRLLPAIKAVTREFPQSVVSADTFRANVARAAIGEGAKMINDISAGELDKNMFSTIADQRVPYILMHMRGTPQTMKKLTDYEDIFKEVCEYLQSKVKQLTNMGVLDLIIDPGFGFAKTMEQNYMLLDKLDQLRVIGVPVLAGLSRKSMIYKLLDSSAEDALSGTIAANTVALMKGASILRVHDVKPAVEAIKVISALN